MDEQIHIYIYISVRRMHIDIVIIYRSVIRIKKVHMHRQINGHVWFIIKFDK